MLYLSQAVHDQIAAHGAASYPHEGCGLLLGTSEGGDNTVVAAVALANVWPVESEKSERFAIDPDEWARVQLEADDDLDVVGIFHSHPDHPPVASPRDWQWAGWRLDGYSFLITQVVAGTPTQSRSWRLADVPAGFKEEEIEIREK
jgi:proteasome lid subunit RPN8/RPN11